MDTVALTCVFGGQLSFMREWFLPRCGEKEGVMAGALWLPHYNPSFQRLSGLARMCLSRGWDVACCPEPDSVRSYGLLLAGFMFSEAVPYLVSCGGVEESGVVTVSCSWDRAGGKWKLERGGSPCDSGRRLPGCTGCCSGRCCRRAFRNAHACIWVFCAVLFGWLVLQALGPKSISGYSRPKHCPVPGVLWKVALLSALLRVSWTEPCPLRLSRHRCRPGHPCVVCVGPSG